MNIEALFRQHITRLQDELAAALSHGCPTAETVLLHSGNQHPYYQDDQYPPFRAWGHFLRWVPVERAGQFLLLRPGARPVLYAVVPPDFWHDQSLELPEWWANEFEIIVLPDQKSVVDHLQRRGIRLQHCILLGENPTVEPTMAEALGIATTHINPPALLAWLDYQRAYKSDYEVHRIGAANALALDGHQAARDAFLNGGDEYRIHLAYLQACQALDEELPYPSIVALDRHAAILHYQHKQRHGPQQQRHNSQAPSGQVLLIDAGCRVQGYCSDITRTWATPDSHPVFLALLDGIEQLQQQVIAEIANGVSYVTLHERAHHLLAELLLRTGVAHGTIDDLLDHGVAQYFMPHGLGHLLGLQVHDVAGHQIDRDGTLRPAPTRFPALRNTRPIEPGMVFTIEPGVYFIPMLLDALRSELHKRQQSALLDWKLIEQLMPLGGIRIEDNIQIQAHGIHNLTRRSLPSLDLPSLE